VFNSYANATNAKYDDDMGLLYISAEDYANLQSLYSFIGTGSSTPFELIPSAQTWPAALIGAQDDTDRIYLVVQDIGDIVPGMSFICGMAFMQRFYTVFDTAGQRIGLAPI
jgi:Eukaryotic aspartyl protease